MQLEQTFLRREYKHGTAAASQMAIGHESTEPDACHIDHGLASCDASSACIATLHESPRVICLNSFIV